MGRHSFLHLFSASAPATIAPRDRLVDYDAHRFARPALGLSLAPPRG